MYLCRLIFNGINSNENTRKNEKRSLFNGHRDDDLQCQRDGTKTLRRQHHF